MTLYIRLFVMNARIDNSVLDSLGDAVFGRFRRGQTQSVRDILQQEKAVTDMQFTQTGLDDFMGQARNECVGAVC
jgi:hypothetical protein